MMRGGVAKENTGLRFGFKFMMCVWFKPRVAKTAKYFECLIIWLVLKENFKGRFLLKKWSQHAIYKVDSSLAS